MFLITLAICYADCGRVHITFMRIESCMMLATAQIREATAEMIKFAMSHNYDGHYVPLFFFYATLASEARQISENCWRMHQLVGILFSVMALLYFFDPAAKTTPSDKLAQIWIKLALTAPIMFTLLMIKFVSWHFEMVQIIWATLTVLSLMLLQAIADGLSGEAQNSPLNNFGHLSLFGGTAE